MVCITKFAPLDTWQQFQNELSSELPPDSLERAIEVLRNIGGYNSPKDIYDMTPSIREMLESVAPTMRLTMSFRMAKEADDTTDNWNVDDGIVVVGAESMYVTDSARTAKVRTFTLDDLRQLVVIIHNDEPETWISFGNVFSGWASVRQQFAYVAEWMKDELGGFILCPPSAEMLERVADPVKKKWSRFQPAVYILWQGYIDPHGSLDSIKDAIRRETGIDRAFLRLTHKGKHVPREEKLAELLKRLAVDSIPALHHNNKPYFQLDIHHRDITSLPVVSFDGDVGIVEVHDGTQVRVNMKDFPHFIPGLHLHKKPRY